MGSGEQVDHVPADRPSEGVLWCEVCPVLRVAGLLHTHAHTCVHSGPAVLRLRLLHHVPGQPQVSPFGKCYFEGAN